jgi:hypothetical protein
MIKFILALTFLLTPFFLHSEDFVAAKIETKDFCAVAQYTTQSATACDTTEKGALTSACQALASSVDVESGEGVSHSGYHCIDYGNSYGINFTVEHTDRYGNSSSYEGGVNIQVSLTAENEPFYSCPPEDAELFEYTEPYDHDGDGEFESCKIPNECGSGYYQFKVGDPLQCVPISCESEGTAKPMYVSGSLYTNNAGTYCDSDCAYSVGSGGNDDGFTGQLTLTGTSTGSVCGQGHPDDAWYEDGNSDDCQTSTNSAGSSSIDCSASEPDGEEPDPDLPDTPIDDFEPEKMSEVPVEDPIEEACAPDDAACEVRNAKEVQKAETKAQRDQTVEAHNKSVDAIAKSTASITEAIDTLRGENKKGNDAVVKAVEETNGDGDGDGDGDCEGSECGSGIEARTEPTPDMEGFWQTDYPDGLQGIVDEKIGEVKETQLFNFMESFKPTFSAGTAPDLKMCFNLGALGNFGCHSFVIDSRVFPAVKIFLLITAVFACRKILFGG